jgi:hypothetical protein
VLAFEPHQRFPHRLTADGVALGQILLSHIIAGCNSAIQDISSQAFIDIVAQKHRSHPSNSHYLAVVIYQVKSISP